MRGDLPGLKQDEIHVLKKSITIHQLAMIRTGRWARLIFDKISNDNLPKAP